MFSKNKEPETTQAAPMAQPSKRTSRSTVPSIISADLVVKGMLVSAGDIQIDGRVEGDIRASALVVGEKASIEGDIYAEDATIRGHIHGSIHARKVQLCSTCRVEGNVLHEAISMESGAFFEGNCRHSDNPLAEGAGEQPRGRGGDSYERKAPPMSPAASPTRQANGPEAPRTSPTANFTPLKS